MNDTLDRLLLKKVARKYFAGRPIKVDTKLSGQAINQKNQYSLGTRAGPSNDISNLFHEMCHFVELEESRLLEKPNRSWGLVPGTYTKVFGQSFFEPQTDQCTQRELRVWAYQLSLHREFGIRESARELVESMTWLPDFCLFQFKYVKNKKLGYDEKEQKAIDIAAKMVEKMSQKYTFGRFEELWFDRLVKLA